MFSIRDFIMKTLRGMAGRYPDFQVREYALNWYAKGKLTEADLAAVEDRLTPEAPDEPDAPDAPDEPEAPDAPDGDE